MLVGGMFLFCIVSIELFSNYVQYHVNEFGHNEQLYWPPITKHVFCSHSTGGSGSIIHRVSIFLVLQTAMVPKLINFLKVCDVCLRSSEISVHTSPSILTGPANFSQCYVFFLACKAFRFRRNESSIQLLFTSRRPPCPEDQVAEFNYSY